MWLCDSVNLWICDSVNLSAIKGQISLPPFIHLTQKIWASIWAKKYVSIFFISAKGLLGQGRGAKEQWFVMLSQPFHKVLVWNYSIKTFKPMAMCQFWSVSTFCIKMTHNYFVFQILNDKQIDRSILGLVGSHAFDQNGPPHGALITWDDNFLPKIYPLWILIL